MHTGFAGFSSIDQLKQFYPIDKFDCKLDVDNETAPSKEVFAILQRNGINFLEKLHWGLVPPWAKDTSIGYKMINARAETVAEKPSFRDAFRKRRCLIIATGFYEWKTEKGRKQPMFITLPNNQPFAFAGLWEIWIKNGGRHSSYKSCTIITTKASQSFSVIHHRMPVILKPDYYENWMDIDIRKVADLKAILKRGLIKELRSQPASKVNVT